MLREMYKARGLMPIWPDKTVDWETRRKQLIEILCEEEYGFMPAECNKVTFEVASEETNFCAGKATLRKVIVTAYFGEKKFSFPIYATIPNKTGKYPFFIHINFRNYVPDRYLPSEELVDRGFAVISFCYQDVSKDLGRDLDGVSNDVDLHDVLFSDMEKASNHCGRIRLWAWAASRAMDYAETLDCLDFSKAAVVGHSRLGKTALVAGALDERFTCAISNDSGCSGAAISRGKVGESIEVITRVFPHWFCDNYKKYADNEDTLPFDQHFLIAAIAPRKAYVASAVEDTWADPDSEFLACFAANEVYENLGMKGLVSPDRLPEVGEAFHEGNIGYHLRSGCHYLGREDWHRFMEYMLAQD